LSFCTAIIFLPYTGTFFERDKIYLPGGYKVWGEFVFEEEDIDPNQLKTYECHKSTN
jgi:hypothetical protein